MKTTIEITVDLPGRDAHGDEWQFDIVADAEFEVYRIAYGYEIEDIGLKCSHDPIEHPRAQEYLSEVCRGNKTLFRRMVDKELQAILDLSWGDPWATDPDRFSNKQYIEETLLGEIDI